MQSTHSYSCNTAPGLTCTPTQGLNVKKVLSTTDVASVPHVQNMPNQPMLPFTDVLRVSSILPIGSKLGCGHYLWMWATKEEGGPQSPDRGPTRLPPLDSDGPR